MSIARVINHHWPDEIPLPFLDYNGDPRPNTFTSEIASGFLQRRSRSTWPYATISVEWNLTASERAAFWAFFKTGLSNGVSTFAIELKYPKNTELTEWEVRFLQNVAEEYLDGIWKLSATLDLIALTVVPDPAVIVTPPPPFVETGTGEPGDNDLRHFALIVTGFLDGEYVLGPIPPPPVYTESVSHTSGHLSGVYTLVVVGITLPEESGDTLSGFLSGTYNLVVIQETPPEEFGIVTTGFQTGNYVQTIVVAPYPDEAGSTLAGFNTGAHTLVVVTQPYPDEAGSITSGFLNGSYDTP